MIEFREESEEDSVVFHGAVTEKEINVIKNQGLDKLRRKTVILRKSNELADNIFPPLHIVIFIQRLISSYLRRFQLAIQIQSLIKGYLLRRRNENFRDCVTFIQRSYRLKRQSAVVEHLFSGMDISAKMKELEDLRQKKRFIQEQLETNETMDVNEQTQRNTDLNSGNYSLIKTSTKGYKTINLNIKIIKKNSLPQKNLPIKKIFLDSVFDATIRNRKVKFCLANDQNPPVKRVVAEPGRSCLRVKSLSTFTADLEFKKEKVVVKRIIHVNAPPMLRRVFSSSNYINGKKSLKKKPSAMSSNVK